MTTAYPASYVLQRVERAAHRAAQNEVSGWRHRCNWLAVIAASAVLVGLFGTTIQLLFHTFGPFCGSPSCVFYIGNRIAAGLAVAALGLLVSVVAVIAYRCLISCSESLELESHNMAMDLRNALSLHLKSDGPCSLPVRSRAYRHESPSLGAEPRLYRNGVLELIAPKIAGDLDRSAVRHQAMWLSFAFALLACFTLYCQGNWRIGLVYAAFFALAGVLLRNGSSPAALSLFGFLTFASFANALAQYWIPLGLSPAVAALLLLGVVRTNAAARPATTLWFRLAEIGISAAAIGLSTLVLFSTVLSLQFYGERKNSWVVTLNPPLIGRVYRRQFIRFDTWRHSVLERVAAVGGDTIYIRAGTVYRNGHVDNRYRASQVTPDFPFPRFILRDEQDQDQHREGYRYGDHPPKLLHIPDNCVFLLNDDLAQLDDSRVFGPVPAARIGGRPLVSYSPSAGFSLFR